MFYTYLLHFLDLSQPCLRQGHGPGGGPREEHLAGPPGDDQSLGGPGCRRLAAGYGIFFGGFNILYTQLYIYICIMYIYIYMHNDMNIDREYIYMYVYIYIYVCVCVCICMWSCLI